VECDAVKPGKNLPAFRRISVLLCRVKQLSLNCFTLNVKTERCFETSVLRSNVSGDFHLQLSAVRQAIVALNCVSAMSAVMSVHL